MSGSTAEAADASAEPAATDPQPRIPAEPAPAGEAIRRAAGAAAFALIGVWSAWEGYSLGLFQFGAPEPGFFPFVFGVLLAAVSLLALAVDLVHALRDGPRASPPAGGDAGRPAGAYGYLVIGVGCGIGMNWIGFLPAVFIGMLMLVRIVERMSWRTSLLTAFGSAVAADLLFVRLLSVPLPAIPL